MKKKGKRIINLHSDGIEVLAIYRAGHTHGMQFGIEIGRFRWGPVKYRYTNWAGLAEDKGKYLYVNRGFGFLGFAGRIGIWPEITIITLKQKMYFKEI